MPWYGWLVLAIGVLIALTAVAIRLLRVSRRGRRFLALPMRGKLTFGRTLLVDPGVPLPAKVILTILVAYLAMPFDLIPDFIPVLGQLDDALVAFLAIAILIVAIPRERFEAALRKAELEAEARRLESALDATEPSGPTRGP
ncbi:MAG TPA: DUF1232 domain-containing protein [Tepidiformaceae bacterium]